MNENRMNISQAKNEINKLQNELDLYLTKKKINFLKTQPNAVKIKDVVTSRTNYVFDKFTHYVIKDENLDPKIYSLQESIEAYMTYVISEMKRMSEYDEVGLINYLKYEEHMSWKQIDKLLLRGSDYSRTKLKRAKIEKNKIDPT